MYIKFPEENIERVYYGVRMKGHMFSGHSESWKGPKISPQCRFVSFIAPGNNCNAINLPMFMEHSDSFKGGGIAMRKRKWAVLEGTGQRMPRGKFHKFLNQVIMLLKPDKSAEQAASYRPYLFFQPCQSSL